MLYMIILVDVLQQHVLMSCAGIQAAQAAVGLSVQCLVNCVRSCAKASYASIRCHQKQQQALRGLA